MTKTLRITGIVAAAAAVLLIALPPVFSSGLDAPTKALLDSPGVLETLNRVAAAKDGGAESPLVQQARAFATYLNPPAPAPAARQNQKRPATRPKAAVSSKFDLLATSYYALRPDMSLALIDEPGSGLRWVRPSSQIGHLTVEEIKDGIVVMRDGDRTYELGVKREPKRSLVKGESDEGTEALSSERLPHAAVSTAVPHPPLARSTPGRGRTRRPAVRQPVRRPASGISADQARLFEQFVEESRSIEDPNELAKRTSELMDRLANSSQVTDEEAQRLDELGEELDDANGPDDANDEASSD